jgi:hypothetical protein
MKVKIMGAILCWPCLLGSMPIPALAQAQDSAGAPPQAAPRPAAAAAKPAASAQAEAGEPRADTSGATAGAQPASAEPPAAGRAAAHPGRAVPKAPVAADRLDLTTTTVTGEHEQPKVMYVVPWKKADIGDLSGKPINSLLDEALAPVDRDEFKREVVYYGAVNSESSGNGAPNKGAQGEK